MLLVTWRFSLLTWAVNGTEVRVNGFAERRPKGQPLDRGNRKRGYRDMRGTKRRTFIVQLDTSRDPLDWRATKSLKGRQELYVLVRL